MRISEIEEILQNSKNAQEIILKCAGLDIVGIGGRRAVVRSREGVWKIPWGGSGERDNEIEWRIWQSADEKLRDLLCPITDRESRSILQTEVLPLSFEAAGSAGHKIIRELAQYGISDIAVNLGLLERRVVCYDYSFISPSLYENLFPIR